MRRTGLTHTIHRRLRIHHHHGNRIAIDRHRAVIAAVVATVLQRFEIEAGFLVKGLQGQLLAQHPIIYKRTGWTCPYKTGHQLPVKLMLLPSA